MARYEPSSNRWSDIFETEFRLRQKRGRRDCTLLQHDQRIRFGLVSGVRGITKVLLTTVRRLSAHQPRSEPSVSCVDPVEAYMHACIAATFFCYVSPELYGLTYTTDEQGNSRSNHPSGEES